MAAACSAASPVDAAPPDAGEKAARSCEGLQQVLPDELDGRERRDTTPGSTLTSAWGDPPVVLRCGVDRPAGLTETSEVLEVEGVAWFLTERPRAYVFTTVGRAPYVELRVPGSTPREQATAQLVDLADPIRRALS